MRIFETALLRGPRFLIDQAVKDGADRAELLAEAGLRPQDIADPDARIPVSRFADLWRAIVSRFPDRDLGVRYGASFHVRRAGLLGFLLLSSADLRAGIERLVRFGSILNESVRPEIAIGLRGLTLSWLQDPLFRSRPQVADWMLAALLTCLRQASQTELAPREVWFPYPAAPRSISAAHRDHFGRSLRFGTERTGFVLSAEQAALPVIGTDTEIGIYLERHAEEVLAKLTIGNGLEERVRQRIWQDLRQGRPTIDGVASGLGMSGRSLQRRLRAEGTSFAEVRDAILRHLANSLLRDRSLAIHEIAVLLGYSEPSSFYRAFRRWAKTSPVDFRAHG